MSAQRQTSKMRERLDRWQAYAAQPLASPAAQERPDTASASCERDAAPAEAAAFAPDRRRERVSASDAASLEVTARYEQQIAQLEADLGRERTQAQEMTTKLAIEVTRQRRERRERRDPKAIVAPPRPPMRKRFQGLPSPVEEPSLGSWTVIGISLLIAGLGSLLAFLLERGFLGN